LQSSHEKIHSRQLIIPEEQEDSLPREHCDNACQCSRHLPGTFMMSQQCLHEKYTPEKLRIEYITSNTQADQTLEACPSSHRALY
jgi:hypothetical protein